VGALGRLDTVVNNAGIMLLGPALGSDIADHREPGTVDTRARPPRARRHPAGRAEPGRVDRAPSSRGHRHAIIQIVTRDRRVAVNEVLIRGAQQTW